MHNLKIPYIILALITCLAFVGHVSSDSSSIGCGDLLSQLAEGDLLFRRGTGVAGHIVVSLDSDGEYSHVGIVVRKNGAWHVVHAVPNEPDFEGDIDRVKIESVDSFLGHYPDAVIGHYRTSLPQEKINIAVDNALRLCRLQVPFDHDYDLSDTTALYCTEFVEYVYSFAGVQLSEGRRTELFFTSLTGGYILPSDLTESSYLIHIH